MIGLLKIYIFAYCSLVEINEPIMKYCNMSLNTVQTMQNIEKKNKKKSVQNSTDLYKTVQSFSK